jgi:hypothetical protein
MPQKANRMRYYPKRYLKRLKDKLEEINTRDALITFRRNVMERQKLNNYSGEYERIRGILQHSVLPHETKSRLIDREAELKRLGAQAFEIA